MKALFIIAKLAQIILDLAISVALVWVILNFRDIIGMICGNIS